jgi:hypothetical protein
VAVVLSRKQWLPAAEQKRPPVPMQQGCNLPPQVPQLAVAPQVPAPAQDWPAAMHWVVLVAVRVQQPVVQRLPGQQGAPAAPHCWHTDVEEPTEPEQTVSGSVQAWPL